MSAPVLDASVDPNRASSRLKDLAESLFLAKVTNISPLAGDASDRSYVRLSHRDGMPPSSIGMIVSAPFDVKELPFLNVQAHFSEIGQPVPQIYAADPAEAVLLLEDCGDDSLEDIWAEGGWEASRPYYLKAVDLLLGLQNATEDRPEERLALKRAFDPAFFANELHHTRRYAFEELAQLPAPEEAFAQPFFELSEAICQEPLQLTHRDYHSRNLMAGAPGELKILDFQDARRGPPLYDLASLVFDSYIPLPEEAREFLIERFWRARAETLFADHAAFRRALALTALQRNLKAIGTFAYQKIVHGTPRYLPHIAPTAKMVRSHLRRLPEWSNFEEQLAPFLNHLEAWKP